MGPQPRQRLYTSPRAYFGLLGDIAAGRATRGDDLQRLEQRVAAFTGAAHAVAAPLARTAIYLVLRALIRPGQDVILSPYTISDVVNMVICAGGRPVFADIEAGTCNIDSAQVAHLIGPHTGAVLVTHFHGLACDVERIAAACRDHKVPLVEDCAQAFGTRVAGRHVGTFGDAGIFSFGLFKNVTSFLGGMVITGNGDLAAQVRNDLRTHAYVAPGTLLSRIANAAATDAATYPPVFRPVTFPIFRMARMHGVDALERRFAFDHDPKAKHTIPDHHLDRVDADSQVRIRAARLYDAGLRGLPGVTLPPLRTDGSHTYQYYPVHVADREALVTFALRNGRDIAVSHHRNCAAMACFAEFARPCPNAERAEREVIYLPTYPRYAASEIQKNIDVIRRFLHGRP
jgi:dTDP-4-amino-4,6-dideoxygalactose transaminase